MGREGKEPSDGRWTRKDADQRDEERRPTHWRVRRRLRCLERLLDRLLRHDVGVLWRRHLRRRFSLEQLGTGARSGRCLKQRGI
jgi:hypothetical protein